ncbi:uncharacterized protein LOC131292818, partial [Anopheles ziemanni]|uniref:uncharacterized protein LOC131271167 n=1 Tax=Anopheles coustani TaxID=139045 RepID=UPI002658F82B
LEGVPPALLGTKSAFNFDIEENIKTLGIRWDPEADVFRLDVSIVIKPSPHSKRSILSSIAQLYDPLGLISPVIVQAKLIMQLLWLLGLHWDDKVPDDLQRKWDIFCEQLAKLQNFTITRFAFIAGYHQAELHCFTDASEAAYGACIYIRSETSDGSVQVSLLTSKSKVAPLKPVTIPRLELCAALLGARLYTKVKDALDMQFSARHFWSDSTVVLQWLQAPARTWKTYVANRVAKIQDATQGSRWRHVSGSDNPADIVSRGCSVDELISDQRWQNGPAWLRAPKSTWPSEIICTNKIAEEELRKDVITLPVQVVKPNEIFERFSSYLMLLRAVGYCLRFCNNTRNKTRRITSRTLLVSELTKATTCLVKIVQTEAFPDEIQRFKRHQPVSTRSSLRLLNPFVDGDGVIRVGGRLQQSDAAYEVRHPIVIPGFHPFTQMLLVHQHSKLLHGGISHTLSAVRDGFWPLNGRKAVRSAIRKCHECCRANPHPIEQPEGQLPVDRVTANDAFICTGIDYCGPIYLKPIHRKAAARKAYICIFVCLSTKAVHLELVSDLSTAAFLMALDRFVYRKGRPTHIYSDNGTNFIGAKNALHAIYAMLNHTKSKEQIDKHLADDAIQWHLIPPRAPNFGGLWEAAVKVAKTHLVRQLGAASLSEEEMATVLAKIEGCMNSRPLTPLSSDPNDLEALTPAHFLIKRPLQPLPEFNASCASQNQLAKYQRLQRFTQSFWDRWCNEYRKELNIAHRRQRKGYQLAEGDLIILKDDQLPPTRWPLARVLELHSGPDGISRVATDDRIAAGESSKGTSGSFTTRTRRSQQPPKWGAVDELKVHLPALLHET